MNKPCGDTSALPEERAKLVARLRFLAGWAGDVSWLDDGIPWVAEEVLNEAAEVLSTPAALPDEPSPLDMILFCPNCGLKHVDEAEPGFSHAGGLHPVEPEDAAGWDNPPHRSHLCHGCGAIWRPADVPTNGVACLRTRGKADTIDASALECATVAAALPDEEAVERLRAFARRNLSAARQLRDAAASRGLDTKEFLHDEGLSEAEQLVRDIEALASIPSTEGGLREALERQPWIGDRIAAGQKFNAYETGDDGRWTFGIGPVTDFLGFATAPNREVAEWLVSILRAALVASPPDGPTEADDRAELETLLSEWRLSLANPKTWLLRLKETLASASKPSGGQND